LDGKHPVLARAAEDKLREIAAGDDSLSLRKTASEILAKHGLSEDAGQVSNLTNIKNENLAAKKKVGRVSNPTVSAPRERQVKSPIYPAWAIGLFALLVISLLIWGVSQLTPSLGIGSLYDSDGVTMLYVPAGTFSMGSEVSDDEKPIHPVDLAAYYIDKFEVTNAAYKRCVDAGACAAPKKSNSSTRPAYYGNPEFDEYPVIYVDWNMAKTYCEWHDARLPTEAEWEKAARGTDGRTYPWGESIDCEKANYQSSCAGDTKQVGSYLGGVSPYGTYDMAGNVWEWVNDWYDGTYYQNSPSSNPLGPDTGSSRVLRGGSWGSGDGSARSADRDGNDPAYTYVSFGFRCSRSP
jgi:serine/threonine-protein kinase